jgi:hypothetical protein
MKNESKSKDINNLPTDKPVKDKESKNNIIGGGPNKKPIQDKGEDDPKDKNKVIGGLADNLPVQDIAKKHQVPVNVINDEIKAGVKVEMEHTSDKNVAYEIAKDHIFEDPKYYTKLKKMEEATNESTKKVIKKFLREDVDLKVVDENPESINVLVNYNGREAGLIVVSPSPTKKDVIEITGIKFKKEYEELHIISQAVNELWPLFKDANSILVAPKSASIEFWNKLGFSRISPNYLISNRGH